MSLTKKVYLTISGYDIKLSDNLTFYQKDQLKLIFYINEYGIDYENNATTRALMPVNPLNAILFIENPEGVDSVSSAKIEDNAVTFYLSSEHTQYIGVSRMQLRLFDQDGCAITLPHFTFEIRENIYGSGDVRFQNVVMVDQTGTVILTEDNDLLDVGDILTMGTEVAYPQVTKTIKELPIKHGLDGTEKLIVEDNEATKQAPLGTIVDEIKQNSQEKIREIESELAQTNTQLSQLSINLDEKLPSETDYTDALLRTLDKCQNFGVISLPQGKEVNFTKVRITKPVQIKGGILNGTLEIDIDEYETNFTVDGVMMIGDNPIVIKQLRDASIKNCFFKNNDKCITILPYKTSGQSVARLNIENNFFANNNYVIYGDSVLNNDISIADIHFINNVCKWSNVTHVELSTIDGIIISNNTFFSDDITTKKHHILVKKWCNWSNIVNNNFFESGMESINICNPENLIISNNKFAWCGQLIRCGAIKIYSTNNSNKAIMGKINNNIISIPSQHGVELDNVDYIDIIDNVVHLEKQNNHFMGNDVINDELFKGVVLKNYNGEKIKIHNKINYRNAQINNEYSYIASDNDTKMLVTGDVLDGKYQILQLNKNEAIYSTIENPSENHEILLYNNVTKVTLLNGNGFVLKMGSDFVMRKRDFIRLKYVNGLWQEISRSVNSAKYDVTLRNNETILSAVTNDCIFALANTTPTTITEITGGVVGKIVTVIAYNQNTTFKHSSTLKLKGDTDVNVPSNGVMQFIYHGGQWFELTRNF